MDTGNTAWILTSTALVLFMTLPGLALFYAGLVRASNILSVLMHCFTIACISSIAWLVIAYSLAFSGTGAYVGDLGNLFLASLSRESMSGDIPESVFFMFQMTFAIITPALIVGDLLSTSSVKDISSSIILFNIDSRSKTSCSLFMSGYPLSNL